MDSTVTAVDRPGNGQDEGPRTHRDAVGVLWVPVEIKGGWARGARPSADAETLRMVREAAWFDGYQACQWGVPRVSNPYHASRAALDGERRG